MAGIIIMHYGGIVHLTDETGGAGVAEINFNKRIPPRQRAGAMRRGKKTYYCRFKTRLSDPYNTTLEKHSFLSRSPAINKSFRPYLDAGVSAGGRARDGEKKRKK
jgi:hypothetical protein